MSGENKEDIGVRGKNVVLNLTQHRATPEQVASGVVDAPPELAERIRQLLTFEELPSRAEVASRAAQLATLAHNWAQSILGSAEGVRVMIGGAPYLMAPLESELRRAGLVPVYAFSRREVIEETLPDGSIRKTQVFRHLGFVE